LAPKDGPALARALGRAAAVGRKRTLRRTCKLRRWAPAAVAGEAGRVGKIGDKRTDTGYGNGCWIGSARVRPISQEKILEIRLSLFHKHRIKINLKGISRGLEKI
jgi:hypothetical protein